jgi:hypothetical protein
VAEIVIMRVFGIDPPHRRVERSGILWHKDQAVAPCEQRVAPYRDLVSAAGFLQQMEEDEKIRRLSKDGMIPAPPALRDVVRESR